MKNKFVIVSFKDIYHHKFFEPVSFEEVDCLDPYLEVVVCGILIKEDKEAVYLSGEFIPYQMEYRNVFVIPKKCIIDIKRVEVKK